MKLPVWFLTVFPIILLIVGSLLLLNKVRRVRAQVRSGVPVEKASPGFAWMASLIRKHPVLIMGGFWGGFMWTFMILIPALAEDYGHWWLIAARLAGGGLVFGLGGMAFGWFMVRDFRKHGLLPKRDQNTTSRIE